MNLTAQKRIKNILLIISIFALIPIMGYFTTQVFAAGETDLIGTAQSLNTGNLIYFNSNTNNSNVVISDPDSGNENKRVITGFAWSEDLGWIKFTQGETAGVYVTYSTGDITGQAYVVNTGGTLDFDSSNGDAVINTQTGDVSGYVWSNDIGWINLEDVYIKDTLKPNNVANVSAYSSSSKESSVDNGVTIYNHDQPYFEWSVPVDEDESSEYASGVGGYFVYWGPSSTATPSAAGTYQSASNFTAPEIATSGTYYLRIQSVDVQGNVFTGTLGSYAMYAYNFDNELPKNVSYIIMPSSSFGNISEMFFSWPSDIDVSSEDNSGVLGWQYSINDTNSWTGSEHHEDLDIDYIPLIDSDYTYRFNLEKDGAKILVGNNIIYFRTVDLGGNYSSYVSGGISFGGKAPSFPAESAVSVSPGENISNNFAISWPTANPDDGRTVAKYYYMVNTIPPQSYATLTDNDSIYIPSDDTSVPAGILRGSVKGSDNTIYVVAVDDQEGYSSSNAISGTYTLDSSLPDPVRNFSINDSSVKEAELWRASLIWEEPAYKGDGNLTYHVSRSTNEITWSNIGDTTGLSYTDIVSESKQYYYKVSVSDGTNTSKAAPSESPTLSVNLKGKYESPATLVSGIVLTSVTTRHATVNWVTDRESDTKIMNGLSSGVYFEDEAYISSPTTNHSISLNNLYPDTRYYFKAKWTDEDGNTGMSQELTFVTEPMPRVVSFVVDRVGIDYAMISFEVEGASKASVYYGKAFNYGGLKEINTSPSLSKYTVMIDNLSDNTTYNYKISLTDSEGFSYDSIENHTFVTPPLPKISSVTIEELKDVASPTISFSWLTNTKTTSVITYYPEDNKAKSLDKVELKMTTGKHTMQISGLNPSSKYLATVEGVDILGNKAVSETLKFTTSTDTRPPEISNVKVQGDLLSSNIQSDTSRSAQLIISWDTDEPSSSRVEYGEGTQGVYTSSSQTDGELRTKHVVILTGLTPSKVYSLKVISSDTAGNAKEFGPVISITPKSTGTVLDTVIKSISSIFNFL